MKTSKMLFAAMCCMVAVAYQPVKATVITVTGGDPGEGYSPEVKNVYAYDLNGTITRTVQGVTFTPLALTNGQLTYNDANISLTNDGPITAYSGYTDPSLGASANDTELTRIIQRLIYDSPLTLTLKGLTPGATYQIDFFTWRQNSYQPASTFYYNGVAGDSTGLIPADTVYDVRQSVLAPLSGQIVVRRDFVGGGGYGLLSSGFSVTIPEPSTVFLLGLGGLLLWRQRNN